MALAIDASTPAVKAMPALAAAGTVTSNTFSPPGGSDCWIIVCLAADGPATGAQTISAVTDSLASHLSWGVLTSAGAVAARSNNHSVAGSEIGGTSEVWIAACPSAQTLMTVTATVSAATGGGSSPDGLILPIVITGGAAVQNGQVAVHALQTTPAAPTLALAGTTAGSLILAVILNYTNATGPTVPGGQSTTINGSSTQQLNATSGDSYWVQMQTALSAGGSVTINDTAPSIDTNMVVVEILAGAGAAPAPLLALPRFLPVELGPKAVGPTFFAGFRVPILTPPGGAIIAVTASDTSLTTDSATAVWIGGGFSTFDTSLTTDSAARGVRLPRTASDTSASTDSASSGHQTTVTASDTSLTTDSASRLLIVGRTASDTSATSDSAARHVTTARTASDTSLTADTATRGLVAARATSDTSTTTDTASRTSPRARSCSDTTATTDTASRGLILARNGSDTTTTSDNASTGGSSSVHASDITATSDAAVRLLLVARSGTDASATTDIAVRAVTFTHSSSDTSITTDAAVRAFHASRSGADTSITSDVAQTGSGGGSRSGSDTTLTTDTAVRLIRYARAASDTSLTADTAARAGSIARSALDTSTSTDLAVRMTVRARSATDTSVTSDAAFNPHQHYFAGDTTLTRDSASIAARGAPTFAYGIAGDTPLAWTATTDTLAVFAAIGDAELTVGTGGDLE